MNTLFILSPLAQFSQQYQLWDIFSAFPPNRFVGNNNSFLIRQRERVGLQDSALVPSQMLIARCFEEVQDSHGSCGMVFFSRVPRVCNLIWLGAAHPQVERPAAVHGSLIMTVSEWLITLLCVDDVLGEIVSASYLTGCLKISFI